MKVLWEVVFIMWSLQGTVWEKSAIGSRYQAMTGDDTAD
jgi:hypothetical protein